MKICVNMDLNVNLPLVEDIDQLISYKILKVLLRSHARNLIN